MPPKKRKGKKAPASLPKFSLFRAILWPSVILVTGLSLFLALRLPLRPPEPVDAKPQTPPVERSAPVQAPARPTVPGTTREPAPSQERTEPGNPEQAPAQPYEAQADDFEARVRNVDLAILLALESAGGRDMVMRHKAVEEREHNGQEFFYQNLTVSLGHDVFDFLARLKQNISQLEPEASLATVDGNPRDLEISILGEPTHHLFLPLTLPPETPETSEPVAAAPKLVIVIDDLGESMATAKRLSELPFRVTFSVLPHNTKARQVAGLARQKGLELLLHLPCEPDGFPKTANSGPGTLRTNMSEATLERTLADNLARLPEVDGVNNHMGSKLTSDAKAMTVVLAHLKGRGKFFLDSLTTPQSCVREVSRKLGMRYYRRHIFLDNSATEHAILLQLRKAESLAKRTGVAVAIGHPYPATLSALETWARTRDMNVTICSIKDI
ncbi:divergent polysaccharide deacetylase family protein [Desulfomicrobium salsuginis]